MTKARAVLAVVRKGSSGDGVGYAGLLLQRALSAITGNQPHIVALDPATSGHVSARERLVFLARLIAVQVRKPVLPVVFNHMGIARAQRHVPKRWRRPYAVFLHGVEAWDPHLPVDRKTAIRNAAVRLSNRHTARRVAVMYPELGDITPCPLSLLPGILPPTASDLATARLIVGTRMEQRVAIVGRMSAAERYKGHDELLEAWPTVRAAFPNARLFVIGRGDDVARLREKASSLGISDCIVFTGFLADSVMRALLAECEVFAMPSRGEGFGLAYLEAMRCGLPCIGSDADAATDVIVDGETGLIVQAGNREALASAIIDLLFHPARARSMGARGREREQAVFTFDAFRTSVESALIGAQRTR